MEGNAMPGPAQRRANLVLITVDCLRADHVGFMGYKRGTTPNMDRLASEGIVFQKAIVAGTPTYHSFPAILAGRFPLALGRDIVGLAPGEPTLAGSLRRAGYATAAFVAGNPYLSRLYGYDHGFDMFEDFLNGSASRPSATMHARSGDQDRKGPDRGNLLRRLNLLIRDAMRRLPGGEGLYNDLYFRYGLLVCSRPYRRHGWETWRRYPSAETVTERALSWVQGNHRRPFFMWIHYMDVHRPQLPTSDALDAVGRRDLTPMRAFELYNFWIRDDITAERRRRILRDCVALYDASIWAVDRQVGRLVDAMDAAEGADRTAVCITSDHGEPFLERGVHDHDPVLLTQEVIHVPLVIRTPGRDVGARSREVFSLVALPRTLLHVLAVPWSGMSGGGREGASESGISRDGVALTEAVYGRTKDLVGQGRSMKPGLRLVCAQDARYKLILNLSTQEAFLYDLESDSTETRGSPLRGNPRVAGRLLEAIHEQVIGRTEARFSVHQINARLEGLRQAMTLRTW